MFFTFHSSFFGISPSFFYGFSLHFENLPKCEFFISHHAIHMDYVFACAESIAHHGMDPSCVVHPALVRQSEHTVFSLWSVFPPDFEHLPKCEFFISHIAIHTDYAFACAKLNAHIIASWFSLVRMESRPETNFTRVHASFSLASFSQVN